VNVFSAGVAVIVSPRIWATEVEVFADSRISVYRGVEFIVQIAESRFDLDGRGEDVKLGTFGGAYPSRK